MDDPRNQNLLTSDDRGFFSTLAGDGAPLIKLTGLALIGSGGFAIFQSVTGQFLPHDVDYLGMTARQLCGINECRIVHFMFHDRVSFGGAIIAIGLLYLWLAEFPLRRGEPWAWWTLALSGVSGFGSFLTYLGYGYLDTWHGIATLALLPCFGGGMVMSWRTLERPRSIRALLEPGAAVPWRSAAGVGRLLLLGVSLGMIGAGFTIMTVGMTAVFVPQDLAFMGMSRTQIEAISPRLIPLIAHDRAGFGGGVCSAGVMFFLCAWCGRPSRHLWQALAAAGLAGFTAAIGVHPAIGYTDTVHLLPAYLGAVTFVLAMSLVHRVFDSPAR